MQRLSLLSDLLVTFTDIDCEIIYHVQVICIQSEHGTECNVYDYCDSVSINCEFAIPSFVLILLSDFNYINGIGYIMCYIAILLYVFDCVLAIYFFISNLSQLTREIANTPKGVNSVNDVKLCEQHRAEFIKFVINIIQMSRTLRWNSLSDYLIVCVDCVYLYAILCL